MNNVMNYNGFEKVSFKEFKKYFDGIEENHLFKLWVELKLPERSTKFSAGYDFFFPYDDYTLSENETLYIPTGIKCEMDNDKVLMCYVRSSYGFKFKARFDYTVGIIDADYYNNPENEGHIMCAITNGSVKPLTILKGSKYMQGIFTKYYVTLNDKAQGKRTGGIGSTDL